MLRSAPAMTTTDNKPRGFAALDRQRLIEIARKGGRAAHAAGTAHRFTPEEAREAGRRGGFASHARRRQPGSDVAPEQVPESIPSHT
jgi:general stress protein YciG